MITLGTANAVLHLARAARSSHRQCIASIGRSQPPDEPVQLLGAAAKDYIDLVVDGCGGSVEMVRGSSATPDPSSVSPKRGARPVR
jgi:hypothetical protein